MAGVDPPRLYLVRHAERTWPEDGLTERGVRQAAGVARWLADRRIDRLLSSPLERARRTAAATAERLALPIAEAPWLAEREEWLLEPGGDAERPVWGLDPATVRDPAVPVDAANWHRRAPLDDPAIRAGYGAVAAGSNALLAELGLRPEEGVYVATDPSAARSESPGARAPGAGIRLAAFAHLGSGLAWLAHLLALPLPLVWAGFEPPQGSVTLVTFEPVAADRWAPRCRYLGYRPAAERGAGADRRW